MARQTGGIEEMAGGGWTSGRRKEKEKRKERRDVKTWRKRRQMLWWPLLSETVFYLLLPVLLNRTLPSAVCSAMTQRAAAAHQNSLLVSIVKPHPNRAEQHARHHFAYCFFEQTLADGRFSSLSYFLNTSLTQPHGGAAVV